MITAQNIKECFANTPQITFEITERCNLNCKYCGYGELYNNKSHKHNRNLSIDDAVCLLKSIKDLWNEGYDSTGETTIYISFYGGEPLLNMTFIKHIVSFIENNMSSFGKKFCYTMTTNALLLKKHIEYLVKKDFHILISLDGDEYATSYRVYHNDKPAFNDIITNIDYVQVNYPDFFENNISFNSVLSNCSTVNGIIHYINSKYNKIPTVSEINNVGIREDKLNIFKKMYRPKISYLSSGTDELFEGMTFLNSPQFERIARYFQMYSPYFFFDYNELLFLTNENRKKTPTGTCMPFSKKTFLTVDGKIMPCERIGYNYVLGYVKNGLLNLDYNNVASLYNSYYEKILKGCSKCKDYAGCQNCFFNTGQLESLHGVCNYFVSQKDFDAMKNEVYEFLKRYPESYEYIMSKYEVI